LFEQNVDRVTEPQMLGDNRAAACCRLRCRTPTGTPQFAFSALRGKLRRTKCEGISVRARFAADRGYKM
jgi:hypothetical protein